jgi:hypothetical protein
LVRLRRDKEGFSTFDAKSIPEQILKLRSRQEGCRKPSEGGAFFAQDVGLLRLEPWQRTFHDRAAEWRALVP